MKDSNHAEELWPLFVQGSFVFISDGVQERCIITFVYEEETMRTELDDAFLDP